MTFGGGLSLQLNSSAILGPAVGLLGLPQRSSRPLKAGTRCQVAGWGSVSNFEELPPGLMEAEVRVLGLDICNSSWRGQLSPAMLCTHSGDRRWRGFCSVCYSLPCPLTEWGNQGSQRGSVLDRALGTKFQLTFTRGTTAAPEALEGQVIAQGHRATLYVCAGCALHRARVVYLLTVSCRWQ